MEKLNVTGMTVLNNFVADYGSTAVAAMGISQKLNTIPQYVALGFSQGIMPLISYNYGGENGRRMKQIILFTAKLSLSFIIVMAFGYYIGSDHLISVFMKNEQIISYGGAFLRGLCIALPFCAWIIWQSVSRKYICTYVTVPRFPFLC